VLLRLLRIVVVAAVGSAIVYGASLYGRRQAILALVVLLIVLGTVLIWLPRAAHRAFQRGRFGRASVLYRLLGWVRFRRETRASVRVSLAACALGMDDYERALAVLDRQDPGELADALRAAWLNNRAYALVRAERDAREALSQSETAISLRPDVAGFRHTRGIALLRLGRLDEAIRELDGLWSAIAGDERGHLLEAERCYDLGLAWRAKGEPEYAADYFQRARRASPDSPWANRAGRFLDDRHGLEQLRSQIE
jgi:tetratricopeptide (TPR) repeat protein